MIYYKNHSTDQFMFKSFEIHSKIFHQKNLKDYFMISSGTNQFSMPEIWKNSMNKEICSDFLYRWYTACEGFQCVTSAIKVYEDISSTIFSDKSMKTKRNVCMSTGGSGAASLVFDYIFSQYKECNVYLVGMNYSLYERLAQKHNFKCLEICNDNDNYSIPTANDFKSVKKGNKKNIFVFSFPNNPSGESYDENTFCEIINYIKSIDGFVLMDMVCDNYFTQIPHYPLQSIITKLDYWDSCALINSFSKSDAVAGLRIGYVYSNVRLIEFCAQKNADSIMNPPTFPAFPILITCLFRCIYLYKSLGKDNKALYRLVRVYEKLFFLTSAIVPNEMAQFVSHVFENIEEEYYRYINKQLNNEKIIKKNAQLTKDVFHKYIEKYSLLEYGFNFCIWFKNSFKQTELELINSLIKNTGVAILTESSFTIRSVKKHQYMMRFSTACNENDYYQALIRMKDYMEKEVFI